MLLFLPQLILIVTLIALLASNLFQRGFRSSWLLSVSGAGLAYASLLFLRFRLPLSSSFSAWWAGEGLVSSISFLLDDASWQLAAVSSALVLAFLLVEVRQAINAPWRNWAACLALAVATLLAAFSGDLLTLAFFWVLVDSLTGLLILTLIKKAGERKSAFGFLPTNITASFLLLAAWILTGSSGQLATLLLLISAALRLGIFSAQRAQPLNSDEVEFLRPLPHVSVLVLLTRSAGLDGFGVIVFLAVLLIPALFNAFQAARLDGESGAIQYFERGFATLALASAALGLPLAALGFGLALLTGRSLVLLAQSIGRWQWPGIVVSLFLLSGLPFSPTVSTNGIYILPIASVFLPVHAALLVGWSRQALGKLPVQPADEPWMKVIRLLGLVLVPMLLLFFGLGLAPAVVMAAPVLWPALVVFGLAAILFVASWNWTRRVRVPKPLANGLQNFFSLRWSQVAYDWALGALGWVLRMMSRVLEGQAGVLWALLLIALLLSLASQFALGG